MDSGVFLEPRGGGAAPTSSAELEDTCKVIFQRGKGDHNHPGELGGHEVTASPQIGYKGASQGLGLWQVVYRPIHQAIIGGNSHFASLAQALTGSQQGYRLQKTSFCILVGIYCHKIPNHTPQSGYHGVTEIAKPANIAKMAENCINCMSARPTPPHTNPMELGPGNTFSAQNRKKPKDS